MGHFLDASQLAELCRELGLENEERFLIDAATAAGSAIASKLHVACKPADNQPSFGGLCVSFHERYGGQSCPEELIRFDPSSDWVRT